MKEEPIKPITRLPTRMMKYKIANIFHQKHLDKNRASNKPFIKNFPIHSQTNPLFFPPTKTKSIEDSSRNQETKPNHKNNKIC
jgi:hypothetical protein